jgi:acylglycerol lipase
MPHGEARFSAGDNLTLYEQWWLPEAGARATVALVHGFTEHSGRYARLAEDLNRRGYAVRALDLRGHGRSEGERCFVRSFDEYLADLDAWLGRMGGQGDQRPFLFGHSMGGTVAALYAIARQSDVRGLILSAPAVKVAGDVFPVLRRLAWIVSPLLPRLRLVRLGSRYISRDAEVVSAYRSDPLVFHERFPVRMAAEIMRAARRIARQAESLRLPLLVMHGTGDRACDYEGSRELCRRAGSADKTLRLYEGLYHEILSDPERGKVLEDMVGWLDARCGR